MIAGSEFGRGFDNAQLSFERGDHADGMVSPGTLTERTFDLASAGVGTRIVCKDIASRSLEIAGPWTPPVDGLDDDRAATVSWGIGYPR